MGEVDYFWRINYCGCYFCEKSCGQIRLKYMLAELALSDILQVATAFGVLLTGYVLYGLKADITALGQHFITHVTDYSVHTKKEP